MKLVISILLFYIIFLLSQGVYGQILTKYKDQIQNYMMTGYERRWHHCDMLSANTSYFYEDLPQITMDLDKIQTLDLKSTFTYSTCLLVHYDVSSKASLSALLEFGWKAINHVRLALLLHMRSGITLETATNSSNLPYLVAARLHDGKEQFLCPVVGEVHPRLGQQMCRKSYLHYKNKILRIGLMGILPDFVMTSTGSIDGTNIRLIKMLAERLRFTPDIILAPSFNAASNQVSTLRKNLDKRS